MTYDIIFSLQKCFLYNSLSLSMVYEKNLVSLSWFVVIKSFLGFLQVLYSVNNISIARYANAPVSSSICHTSLWLFFWPASSLILPIHWRPSHSVAPGAFEGSRQPPSQNPHYCSLSHFLWRKRAKVFPIALTRPSTLFCSSLSVPVVIYMSMGTTQRLFSGLVGLNSSL